MQGDSLKGLTVEGHSYRKVPYNFKGTEGKENSQWTRAVEGRSGEGIGLRALRELDQNRPP